MKTLILVVAIYLIIAVAFRLLVSYCFRQKEGIEGYYNGARKRYFQFVEEGEMEDTDKNRQIYEDLVDNKRLVLNIVTFLWPICIVNIFKSVILSFKKK